MFRTGCLLSTRGLAAGVLGTLVLVAGCSQTSGRPSVHVPAFTRADVGTLPAGWTPMVTNGSAASTDWRVTADGADSDDAVLSLVRNENGRAQFNLCVYEGIELADVDLSAECRGDYGVGIVWRCLDADNYYVCRVNSAEGNFNLYKVVGGERSKLATVHLKRFVDGQWYRVHVSTAGEFISCGVDGHPLITTRDTALPHAGRIGVWTRADALGSFRRIEIREHPGVAEPEAEDAGASQPAGAPRKGAD